ncbi:MAG: hypothetical protein PHC34_10685 [Candidatus Gastranaerophilales bacterium]|nr:hypothetical protein [Candidatus Gastranaerophilales bacterium]
MEASKLYSQFQTNDRRRQNNPVAVERRSGVDRRQTPRLSLDAESLQDKDTYTRFRKQQEIDATPLSMIPPLDKVEEIQDSVKEKNYCKAVGIYLLLINSFRKDVKDLKRFKNDILKIIKDKKFRYEDHQERLFFTQGSEIDRIKVFNPLIKLDITLFDFKFCQYILKKFGMTNYHEILTGSFTKSNEPTYKIKVIGNKFVEILGRSFLRTPILGVCTLSLLEIPNIIKAKKHKKQIIKSTISITSIITGGAILGTIGAYYPPLGFITTGIGAYLGYKLSDYFNKKI